MRKLRLQVNGEECTLEREGESYRITGPLEHAGQASIANVQEDVFSVLLDGSSYTAHVLRNDEGALEVWIGNRRYSVVVSDPRDRAAGRAGQSQAGPFELRALMPGRVVKVLVAPGEQVGAGQSLIVVEAMKMQNEMKSPKDGVVRTIYAVEGAAVGAGERLLLVE